MNLDEYLIVQLTKEYRELAKKHKIVQAESIKTLDQWAMVAADYVVEYKDELRVNQVMVDLAKVKDTMPDKVCIRSFHTADKMLSTIAECHALDKKDITQEEERRVERRVILAANELAEMNKDSKILIAQIEYKTIHAKLDIKNMKQELR